MKSYTSREVIKILQNDGWYEVAVVGSHHQFKHETKITFFYPAIFTYNGEKEIAVIFPDLNCATSGEDEADALLSARELLGCVLCGLEDDGEPIPEASHLSNIKMRKNEKAVLIDVYLPTYRMMQKTHSVNRTVTLPAWLSALASEHNINCSQLLQESLKKQLQTVLQTR